MINPFKLRTAAGIALAMSMSVSLAVSGAQAAVAASIPDDPTAVIDAALTEVGQPVLVDEVPSDAVEIVGDSATVDLGTASIDLTLLDSDSEFRIREDGVQALTVLKPGEDVASFRLDVPDSVSVEPNATGGFDLIEKADGVAVSYAQVQAPWAVDADGTALATSYDYVGGVITQKVQVSGATYPVVADPKITVGLWNAPYGPGVYVNFTGAEMNALAAAIIAAGGIGVIAGCTISKLPPQIRLIVTALCGALGYNTLPQLFGLIQQGIKKSAFRSGTCYQTLAASNRPFVATARSNCS